jgi:2-polyprenyl-3-methyl-5-hydroxy-6-metoxy-1,4-benzoquinol methylase
MAEILLDIEIPAKPDGPGMDGNGVHAFVYRGEEVRELEKQYGRSNCLLKVFKTAYQLEGWWAGGYKGSPLKEAVAIQNIYSQYGLAPRVYALFTVLVKGESHWAYLSEDLGNYTEIPDSDQTDLIVRLRSLGDELGIEVFDDGRKWNVIDGKYVDFQGFRFKADYREKLKHRLVGVANIGKWGPFMNYHTVPELDISGGRDNEERILKLGLDNLDFAGKTVLDVGCSEGFFCRLAADRGAKRVVGIDLPGVVMPTQELTFYLGYNNVDFYGYDLKTDTPDVGTFDIVLFLSMVHHIGLPQWLLASVGETLVFEGNGKREDEPALSKLNEVFPSCLVIGTTTDLLERPVVWMNK